MQGAVKDLITRQSIIRLCALKGEVLIVETKVSLSIIAAEGELAEIFKVLFGRIA